VAVGAIGNTARTLLRLPGINNWDTVRSKSFSIRERVRVQLRCELYNAFNHNQSTPLLPVTHHCQQDATGGESQLLMEMS
jgi:hypothetical protein